MKKDIEKIIEIFKEPKIIGIVGDVGEGRSNLVYHIIEGLKQMGEFNFYTYGLINNIKGENKFFSIQELEEIKNSIIFLDEFYTLFDLDNIKIKRKIERTFSLIHNNKNIIVLVGLPKDFNKFISGNIDVIFYKRVTFANFIRGSSVKSEILDYRGLEAGSEDLNLDKNEAIIYDKSHYTKIKIPYLKKFDTKKDNPDLFIQKKFIKK